MIIAGTKEHNERTLEVTYDMRNRNDVLAVTQWQDSTFGGVYAKDWIDIKISEDKDERRAMVQRFAQALGVDVTVSWVDA